MDDSIITWLVLAGIGVFTLIIIIIFSFSSIAIGEIGLDYSALFKSIDSEPYIPGFHYIGLTHSFITFPSIVQTIEFSIDAVGNHPIKSRTYDGLEVILEISFQYRLMPDKLHEMYMRYGPEYQKVFTAIAIDVLTDMTTKFTAYRFFYDRQSIGDVMKKELGIIFQEQCYSTVEFFQLRTVDLPDHFENSIQDTEVKKQDIQKAKAEQVQNEVEWQTRIREAEFQGSVYINRAMGEGQEIFQNNLADVKNINVTQLQQAEAYASMKQHLQLTNVELLDYIKSKIIKEYQTHSNLIISFDALHRDK